MSQRQLSVLTAAACAAAPLLQPGACQQSAEMGGQGPAPAKAAALIWETQVKARESCAEHPDSQEAEGWSAGRTWFLVPALLSVSVFLISKLAACKPAAWPCCSTPLLIQVIELGNPLSLQKSCFYGICGTLHCILTLLLYCINVPSPTV